MTTGNTTLLGLALPVQGELSGTWGDTVNNSLTSLVDSAVAGTTALSADADVTLTDTALVANQARQAVLLWTASNGATTRNITAPARSKPYIVINAGTGSVVLRGAGPTAGVTIVSGEKCLAAWNGSDFVKIATSAADGVTTFSAGTTGFTPSTNTSGAVTLAGTLGVANGGTGATTLTTNNVLLGNGTSALQVVAPGTTGNVLTSNGTTWTSATPAAQVYPSAGVAVSTGTVWGTSLTAPSGALVGTTDTQTLTNKRVTTRIISIADAATITPTGDTADQYNVTALAQAATIAAPSGTPTDGQKLVLRIEDNGTARALTWTITSGAYRAVGVTLPTTTVISKVLYIGCIYNAQDVFWDVVAVAQQA